MKIVLTICAAVLCSVCFLMLSPMHKGVGVLESGALASARSMTPKRPNISSDFGGFSVELFPEKDVQLNLLGDESYLSAFRFAGNGDIYFVAYSSDMGDVRVSRINALTQQREQLVSLGAGQGHLMDIDIDDGGQIYGALTFPGHTGAINIWSSDGSLVSTISTKRFLPGEVRIDSEKRIWLVGQRYDSSGAFAREVQVRVYERTGKLLSVPLGGLAIDDTTSSVFFGEGEHTRLTSNKDRVVYDFSGLECEGSRLYPLLNSDRVITTTANNNDKDETIAVHVVGGVSRVNDTNVWYGNVRDPQNPGVYSKSFIGLTTQSEEALTSQIELDLPRVYGNIAGVDSRGYIYAFAKEASKSVLKKLRIKISGAKRSSTIFSTIAQ